MSALAGLAACALSSVLFGTTFVPVKSVNAGNGIFAQWLMSCTILCVGLVVYAIQDFPKFEPLAMFGGMLWALGNLTAVPIMNVLGLGLGMLIWGVTNCITGWAVGRFGLFGVHASVPTYPIINYLGLALVIVGGILFSHVRPIARNPVDENSRLLDENDDEEQARDAAQTVTTTRQGKRVIAIVCALFAGIFYGTTFTPVIYIQDHPELFPGAPANGLAYVFPHFCGIFATATIVFVAYIAYTGNKPYAPAELPGPGLLAGCMWAIAQSSWFVANDNLSQSVTFPIISMVPGVIASLWSVLHFKEIHGSANLRCLMLAIVVTVFGATLVGMSK